MPDNDIMTAAQIDAIAKELEDLQAAADKADAAVKAKKGEIQPLITRYGHAPDGTAKSLRLEGEIYRLTATFGQSVSVVKKNVEKLRDTLRAERQPGLFKKLFLSDVDYIVAPEAESWTLSLSRNARKIYDACIKTSQKKPTVKVDRIVEEAKKTKKAKKANA